MILFIDRLPLYYRDEKNNPPRRSWSVSLPAIASAVELGTPTVGIESSQRWVLDTGNTLEASAWRFHLHEAGLNPQIKLAGRTKVRSANGATDEIPIRKAALWLFSNVPAHRSTPFRISLDPGIAFFDSDCPKPDATRPLIGMRALRRAGVKIAIDFSKAVFSLWIPGSWVKRLFIFARRALSGFSTLPIDWRQ